MSVLNRIAYLQNRHDETPNRELARKLVATQDRKGIREIAENLWNENHNVSSDCIKVLYEIGCLDPELIAGYVGDLVKLLKHKNNRMVWGSMIALSTIAAIKADDIYQHVEEIERAMEQGSVITIDNGVKILAIVASKKEAYGKEIFPYLLKHLETCRPKDVPQHAESTLAAVNARNKKKFIQVLEKRMTDLSSSQASRVRKVSKEAEKR